MLPSKKKMIQILLDKGHGMTYATLQAGIDDMNRSAPELIKARYDCSVCRQENIGSREWRYHYHACE